MIGCFLLGCPVGLKATGPEKAALNGGCRANSCQLVIDSVTSAKAALCASATHPLQIRILGEGRKGERGAAPLSPFLPSLGAAPKMEMGCPLFTSNTAFGTPC